MREKQNPVEKEWAPGAEMELLDIVDEKGNPTGETVPREVAHREGIRHRTAHVWIFRRRGGVVQILLQKRSDNKDSLNRTYKALCRPTNGFDNVDGANYDLALWVAYYNFLRPHKHNKYKVLNDVEMLHGASNMPGKWQLLIFLGQQTILNLQNGEAANCS